MTCVTSGTNWESTDVPLAEGWRAEEEDEEDGDHLEGYIGAMVIREEVKVTAAMRQCQYDLEVRSQCQYDLVAFGGKEETVKSGDGDGRTRGTVCIKLYKLVLLKK